MGGPWLVLAVTLAIQAFVSMAVLAVPAMAPAMAEALRVSPSLVGAYVAAVYVGAIVASTLAGPLVLRFGALRVSQWGLLGCAAGMALLALWPSIPVALVSAFLTGLGYGPITPASSHVLARTAPPDRASLVFSIKQTGVPLGGVMAGALVPPLVVSHGVDAALWMVALACVACAFVAQPLRAELDADRDATQPIRALNLAAPIALVARHPLLARLAAYSFVFSAMQMCLSAYLVTYLNTDVGYSLVAAGAALSMAQTGGVVGRVLWGYVADRWLGARRMLALLAALMSVCAASAAALHAGMPRALVLAVLVVFGASATGWNGVYLAEVARRAPPGQAGTATGGSLAITFFGVVLGPMLFGLSASVAGSLRAGFVALAVATAVCAWQLRVNRS
jgi:MFS family permease